MNTDDNIKMDVWKIKCGVETEFRYVTTRRGVGVLREMQPTPFLGGSSHS